MIIQHALSLLSVLVLQVSIGGPPLSGLSTPTPARIQQNRQVVSLPAQRAVPSATITRPVQEEQEDEDIQVRLVCVLLFLISLFSLLTGLVLIISVLVLFVDTCTLITVFLFLNTIHPHFPCYPS